MILIFMGYRLHAVVLDWPKPKKFARLSQGISCQYPSPRNHVKLCMLLPHIPGVESLQIRGKRTENQKTGDGRIRKRNRSCWGGMILRSGWRYLMINWFDIVATSFFLFLVYTIFLFLLSYSVRVHCHYQNKMWLHSQGNLSNSPTV